MKIFVYRYGSPMTIAHTIETREILQPHGGYSTGWDVYQGDHFGCQMQGFGNPDFALEAIEMDFGYRVFVWDNPMNRDLVSSEWLIDESDADKIVKPRYCNQHREPANKPRNLDEEWIEIPEGYEP
ncbi:hypothetical protein SEA_CAMERICO_93 [Gordonia phage Camerico]|nr:hypothetical protein SEA_CAMERICO_93 [Gordonia phage Camerico]